MFDADIVFYYISFFFGQKKTIKKKVKLVQEMCQINFRKTVKWENWEM